MRRIALVTGGGSGIGRAVSLAFDRAGFTVVITGRRRAELEQTVQLSASVNMFAVPADISLPADVARLFAHIESTHGRLDVLFNNAGRGARAVPLDELTDDEWFAVVNVNLNGAFLCAREAFRLMRHQQPQGGRIINNGSVSAHVPRPFSAPYTATKHAITGLTKSLSLDGRQWSIACGQIDIGNAATEMTERMSSGVLQADGSTAAEPRMDVQHVADAVVFMANLPLDANVQFLTVMATQMPFIGP